MRKCVILETREDLGSEISDDETRKKKNFVGILTWGSIRIHREMVLFSVKFRKASWMKITERKSRKKRIRCLKCDITASL